jgi:hypothetical protein
MAYNPTNNSLYLTGHTYGQLVAEISIPSLVNSQSISSLNTATIIQPFADISEGHMDNYGSGGGTCNASGDYLGGMMVWGSKIVATAYGYYDAADCAKRSHFTSGKTFSVNDFSGLFVPSNVPQAGFIDGWMTPIPYEYQSALGGKALSGNAGLSILGRTSWGPAAFSFDPDAFGAAGSTFTTYPVLYYSQTHPGLGAHDATSPVWNATSQFRGMHFIPNTKTILYTGFHGTGSVCYGEAAACGNDPLQIYKGFHAYPYHHQIWAYNVDDLIAVKNGTKFPWQIQPYSYWTVTFPYGDVNDAVLIGGSAYDSTNKRLFIAQAATDGSSPIIHVFSLNVSTPSMKIPNSPTIILVQ